MPDELKSIRYIPHMDVYVIGVKISHSNGNVISLHEVIKNFYKKPQINESCFSFLGFVMPIIIDMSGSNRYFVGL